MAGIDFLEDVLRIPDGITGQIFEVTTGEKRRNSCRPVACISIDDVQALIYKMVHQYNDEDAKKFVEKIRNESTNAK